MDGYGCEGGGNGATAANLKINPLLIGFGVGMKF